MEQLQRPDYCATIQKLNCVVEQFIRHDCCADVVQKHHSEASTSPRNDQLDYDTEPQIVTLSPEITHAQELFKSSNQLTEFHRAWVHEITHLGLQTNNSNY